MVNPYKQYKQQAVLTLSPGELVVKLLDRCITDLEQAKAILDEKNDKMYLSYHTITSHLHHAITILEYMIASLDMQYEISDQLSSLYEFYIWKIKNANSEKNPKILAEIIPMISDIKTGFIGAEREVQKAKAKKAS
ncbi:MAG: flagellar protein FliS [Ruminococcus sp.]|jgi:flagellar protein FliS|nr:flagellar protein FliS [Ruminococcus sp.]